MSSYLKQEVKKKNKKINQREAKKQIKEKMIN